MKTVAASNSKAKELFKKNLYSKATKQYHRSQQILQISSPQNDTELAEIKKLLSQVYINLAVCYTKMRLPKKVLLMCDDLGRIVNTEKHCKCLFYYGKAFHMLGEYDEAVKFYKKALKIEPKNHDIGQAMAELNALIEKGKTQEKEMWKHAFKNNADKKEDSFEDLEDDFKNVFQDTCKELSARTGHARFDLPSSMVRREVDFIETLIKKFDSLSFDREVKGGQPVYSIIKKA